MNQIRTFVFLDFETTGILEHEIEKTKITELSLIAVNRNHLLSTRIGLTPRVQSKITLCIHPWKMILPSCTLETGLCNDLLENESSFNTNVYTLLKTFLSTLSAPVCLIAHNGLEFDFPLLKSHLENLGATFSEDLLCSDSLIGFREIMENEKNESDDEIIVIDDDDDDIQIINEMTPAKKCIKSKTTEKLKSNSSIKALRGQMWHNNKLIKPYRLKNIYERLLKRHPREAHRAENDCLMLLECAVALAKDFVPWADKNNYRFSDIKPLSRKIRRRYF